MEKIITAEFENIDFAEAAARELREKVEGVREIMIRVGPHAIPDHQREMAVLSLESAAGNAAYTWNSGNQLLPLAPVWIPQSSPSQPGSQKAVLEVHVSQETDRAVPRAVNCLFNKGGYDVNIQN